MLKLQFKDQRQPPFRVVDKLSGIGSAADNQLVLTDPGIAPVHARLIATSDTIVLEDNNSDGGCFVNGQRITQKEILPGDQLRLGPVELEVLDAGEERIPGTQSAGPWRLVASGSWLSGQSYPVPEESTVVIGRSDQCDIVIPGTHLARRHVELRVQGGSLHVKDLGSVNGTYLNDRPLTEGLAHNGDRLRLDVYSFRIVGPAGNRQPVRRRPATGAARTPPPKPKKPSELPPRRWKTRPTSPGNRQEPTYKERSQALWLWFVVLLATLLLIAAFYWV